MANELMENLMEIDLLIQDVSTFVPIKMAIDSLDIKSSAYKKIMENTNQLIRVLKAFSEIEI